MNLEDHLNPPDVAGLARRYAESRPFHHVWVDAFLRPEFAAQISRAFPTYPEALAAGGQEFSALNEKRKTQVTDASRFPEPVRRLSQILSSREFLDLLTEVTGIERLLADPLLFGGGMHLMCSGGRLDVHVDFNLLRERGLHRRLNILIFFNEEWKEEWGGQTDLWDGDVQERVASLLPSFNRCLLFNTTERSWHGVTPLRSPNGITRNSFAAYYYTREPPPAWDGQYHSTVFRPRPDERWRQRLLSPVDRIARVARRSAQRVRRVLRGPR